jgi:hypothetical protein
MTINNDPYVVALNLGLLSQELQGTLKEKMAFLAPYKQGWTQEEVNAIKQLISAINKVSLSSEQAMDSIKEFKNEGV